MSINLTQLNDYAEKKEFKKIIESQDLFFQAFSKELKSEVHRELSDLIERIRLIILYTVDSNMTSMIVHKQIAKSTTLEHMEEYSPLYDYHVTLLPEKQVINGEDLYADYIDEHTYNQKIATALPKIAKLFEAEFGVDTKSQIYYTDDNGYTSFEVTRFIWKWNKNNWTA